MSISGLDRLEKSIENFKLSLKPEDHHTLKNYPDPSAEDVADFVKNLDAKLQQKQKRRKTLQSSSFTTFIRAMQQFSGIIDTCVQSNPEIAALVWGGMKFVLLAFSNYTKYLEEIVDMCDQMGRLCPQFDRFSKLFPKHKELQSAICDFYAIVVDFFREALLFLYSSVLKQLAVATFRPFEEKFSDIFKSLDLAKNTIDREITLSSEQELQVDRVNNAQLRTDVRDLCYFTRVNYQYYHDGQVQLNEEAQRSKRERILQNISRYSYYTELTNNLQKRIEGSGLWIYKTPEYESWANSPKSCGLWYHGIPGFGKSVLTSGVIDTLLELSRSSRPKQYRVAYFFCTFTTASSLLAYTILSSLLHQLFYYSHDLPRGLAEDLEARFEDRIRASQVVLADIQNFITEITKNNRAINYIVVDGLDECNDKERGMVLRALKKLLQDSPKAVRVLISSRGSQDIARALVSKPNASTKDDQKFQGFGQLSLGTSNQEDVEAFISQTLLNKELEGQLPELPSYLFTEVKLFLSKNAKGLFIWVNLLIEEICNESKAEDIEMALSKLPKDLDGLYNRVIDRIMQHRRPEVAQEIFKWIAYAIRPLTLEELKEATCLKNTQIRTWAELSKLAEVDEMKWLQNCENLVIVNKAYRTVQFAHSTIKQFLESRLCCREKSFLMDRYTNHQLAEACVRYYKLPEISDPSAQYQQTPVSKKALNSLAMIANVNNSAQGSTFWASTTDWMTRKLYQSTSLLTNPAPASTALVKTGNSNILISQRKNFKGILRAYPFLEYATSCWVFHYIEYGRGELARDIQEPSEKPREVVLTPGGTWFHTLDDTNLLRGKISLLWGSVPALRPSTVEDTLSHPGNHTPNSARTESNIAFPMFPRTRLWLSLGLEEKKSFIAMNIPQEEAQRICNLILQRFPSIRFPWQNYFTPESLTFEEGLFDLLDWALGNGVGSIFELIWVGCCIDHKVYSTPISHLKTELLLKYWLPAYDDSDNLSISRFEKLCAEKDADTAGMWASVFGAIVHDASKGGALISGNPGGRLSTEPTFIFERLQSACGEANTLLFHRLIEILSYLPKTFESGRFQPSKYLGQINYQKIVGKTIEAYAHGILKALHQEEYQIFIRQVSPEDQFRLLELATELGCSECFEELISHYRFGLTVSTLSKSGQTILQRATELRDKDIVSMCLERSTDLLSRSRTNRFYPLQIAAMNNDLDIIKVMAPFIRGGGGRVIVDMTAPHTSDTALTYAIKNLNTEIVRVLLNAGASWDMMPERPPSPAELQLYEEDGLIEPGKNYPMLQFATTPSEEILDLFLERDKAGFFECLRTHKVATEKLIRLAERSIRRSSGGAAQVVLEKIAKALERFLELESGAELSAELHPSGLLLRQIQAGLRPKYKFQGPPIGIRT
ncbi:hypothetical protein AOL_s00043g734 [Orbilia oligospora ATCC 24927]|uniref:Uncharacterized protein n=1 Tax=Arthrobotrys oligospora (strain ATCC 24927 / CBS 115.81 / DSM 1491) TaxID=756982 RepID=G1X4W0_ARTOA|nr:hypothetical protein AOL_s00043g734 [Orbilia oligospora ATCC 24927]EGX52000.1 hypothetical protein AOL_s00043g734 [Orbilia oligospora ATCC 24927]